MMAPPAFTPQQPVYIPHETHPGPQQPSHQPRLMYFITRTNGTIVPLVPTDELPYTVRLEGAPRNTPPEQTFGMQCLGAFPYTGTFFKTKDDSAMMQRSFSQPGTSAHHRQDSNGKQYMAPDALARQATVNAGYHCYNSGPAQYPQSNGTTNNSPQSSSPPLAEATNGLSNAPPTDTQAIIDAIVASKSGAETAARVGYTPPSQSRLFSAATTAPPSGKIPDANKKTHCTYWIRTGECDYTQQGCMYKHEMPDEKGLRELGFRGTPSWWVQRNQTIRLGEGGEKRNREYVGERISPKVWLRRASDGSSDDGEREGKESEKSSVVESEGEKGCAESVKGEKVSEKEEVEAEERRQQRNVQKTGHGEKVSRMQRRFGVYNAPEQSFRFLAKPGHSPSTVITSDKPTQDGGDLIDFGSSGPSLGPTLDSNSLPTTLPTSAGARPRHECATPSASTSNSAESNGDGKGKAKTLFVPKGESKSEHLADHTSRQQRRASPSKAPRSKNTNENGAKSKSKLSEAQVASLERQIQMAGKSKRVAPSAGPSTGAGGHGGLMESRHAPVPAGREKVGKGKGKGKQELGLRVRRPATVRYMEIPTNRNQEAWAAEREKQKEAGNEEQERCVKKGAAEKK